MLPPNNQAPANHSNPLGPRPAWIQEWGLPSLTPEHKFDHAAVDYIKNLPISDQIAQIPGLVYWLQDINWPVAHDCLELLLALPHEVLLGPIRDVLFPQEASYSALWDDELMSNVLESIVSELGKPEREALKPDLVRFKGEITDQMDEDRGLRETVDRILAGLDGES